MERLKFIASNFATRRILDAVIEIYPVPKKFAAGRNSDEVIKTCRASGKSLPWIVLMESTKSTPSQKLATCRMINEVSFKLV